MTKRRWPDVTPTLLGALTAAMTLINVALVPFWRHMEPKEFRAWFARYGPRIGAVMIPLGAATALSAAASAVTRPRSGWLLPAFGAGGIATVTMVVNEPINHTLMGSGILDDDQIDQLRQRWARWHNVRVALGLGAVAATLIRSVD